MTTESPYAARPWLTHYDYWVRPHLAYPGRPLADILNITAVERPDRPATQFLGAQLTFLDLKHRADALAVSLARLGIVKGDRVGIMLPNCPQYIIAAFAVLRIGAAVVNINPSYTAREVLTVAADSGARALITLDALTPLVQEVRPQTSIEQIIVTSLAEYSAASAAPPDVEGAIALASLLTPVAPADLPRVAIDPQDLAVLQYTGGTTGTPKGAMLTHGNIWANVVQAEAWTNPTYAINGNERYLVVIPYFHIYAFTVCMMVGLRIGALQIVHPKYDPEQVLASIRDFHGEIVKACVALKPASTVTAEEIIAHCRTSLTEYKVPRRIEIRETLPMSAVGKILYRVLRDEHAATLGGQA